MNHAMLFTWFTKIQSFCYAIVPILQTMGIINKKTKKVLKQIKNQKHIWECQTKNSMSKIQNKNSKIVSPKEWKRI